MGDKFRSMKAYKWLIGFPSQDALQGRVSAHEKRTHMHTYKAQAAL